MPWWVYKCNNKDNPYKTYGDWREFFDRERDQWGSTAVIRELEQLKPGDTVLAYQTNRNELVGVVRVVELRGAEVHLEAKEVIGVKVRPLKVKHPGLAQIPAFQPRERKTLYRISKVHANLILSKAREELLARGAKKSW